MGSSLTTPAAIGQMFRLIALSLLALLALLLPGLAQAASRETRQHYTAELVAESKTPKSGNKLSVAIHITPQKGWHIYWSNPGESGYAPAIAWTMPAGFQAGHVQHPAPVRLFAAGLTSFVHEGDTILLQDLVLPRGLMSEAPVRLTAAIDLLVCSEGTCVPDPVTLDIVVTPGSGGIDPEAAGLFTKARALLPEPLATSARFLVKNGSVQIFLPGVEASSAGKPELFLEQADVAKAAGTATLTSAEGGSIISAPVGTSPPVSSFTGVLVLDGKSYAFDASKSSILPTQRSGLLDGLDLGFLVAFGTAVLGGLILNLMPCVFPILSLKALSLVKYGESEKQARIDALGYSLGAIGTVVALGAVLLLLRSGGSAVGWAFQLQNPIVVSTLLLLVVAIAMNLAGLFELPSLNVTSGHKGGFLGSASTGALAAFIATPCTGPFMAGALGAALVMPPFAALLVMAGLGIGMALPFFCIGFFKPIRRRMPRAGNWMVTLRRLLSLPMFATAVGLAWILGRLGGVSTMAVSLAAAVVLGLGLWWYGMRQHSGKKGMPALAVVGAAMALVMFGIAPTPVAASPEAVRDELNSIPFSEAGLARLRSEGKPVFLYFTADWCLTCKVNEATSLSSPRVADAFRASGVTVMRADWTRQARDMTAFLKAHGRAGVPLYLWYPSSGAGEELPQLLTPEILVRSTS